MNRALMILALLLAATGLAGDAPEDVLTPYPDDPGRGFLRGATLDWLAVPAKVDTQQLAQGSIR